MPLYLTSQNANIEDVEIREINDSLQVSYRIEQGRNPISESQALYLNPVLIVGESHHPLQKVILAGKNKRQVLRRWANNYKKELTSCLVDPEAKNDPSLYFNMRIPYLQKADSACILTELETLHYRGNHTSTSDVSVSPIIREEQKVLSFSPRITSIPPEKEYKLRSVQTSSTVFFKVGHWDILSAYMDNHKVITEIEEILHGIINNKNILLESIHIYGYASPEGRYRLNEALALKRGSALKEHIKSIFNIPDSLLKIDIVPEDWDGLVTLVEAKGLLSKEAIGNIISIEDDEEREAALKQLDRGKPYRIIQKELFVQLRRAACEISYSIKEYNQDKTKLPE